MTRHRYYCEHCQCGLGGDLDNPSANYKCGIHNFETGGALCGACYRLVNGLPETMLYEPKPKAAKKVARAHVAEGQMSLWAEGV